MLLAPQLKAAGPRCERGHECVAKTLLQPPGYPMRLRNPLAIFITLKRPPTLRQTIQPMCRKALSVEAYQLKNLRFAIRVASQLWLADPVKLGKMKEAQWFTSCSDNTVHTNFDWPAPKIPGRDIIARMPQHGDIVKKGRYKIAPTLVDEDAVCRILPAKLMKTIAPPSRECHPISTRANGDKAQVIDAVLE